METIKWNNEWNLNIKTIDNQHKKLIKLLNMINKGKMESLRALNGFIEYTSDHFIDEEYLMHIQKYDYREYTLHKKEHRKFKEALLEISFKILEVIHEEEELNLMLDGFKKFCYFWFEAHFLNTDKKFVEFIKKGGGVDKEKVFEDFINT